MKLSLFALLLLTALACPEYSYAEKDKNINTVRQREFERYLTENVLPHVPGAALLVVAGGDIQLLRTYGVRTVASGDPITTDTVFRLASVSKTFASAAAGILVGNNQLDWDTPVSRRLQHVQFKDSNYGNQITVRNLLSHTTGLVQHAYTNLVEDNVPYEVIVGRLREVDFVCAPGTCYSYQNVAFSLTGDIVRSVTGKPYEDFVRDYLFHPLGMKTASFGLQSFIETDNRATPHVRRNSRWQPVKVNGNYYNIPPAAGINASINDMAQWLLAQLGQRPDVISETVLDDIQNRVIKTSPSQAHYKNRQALSAVAYGLGWRIFDYGGQKNFIHHGGWVQGTLSDMVFNRELQLGMVFLTNAETPYARGLIFDFLDIYQEQEYKKREVVHVQTGSTDSLTTTDEI